MKSEVNKIKKQLINAYCEEARYLINNSKNRNIYLSCDWVDFIDNELIQYEFVGAYVGVGKNTDISNGKICLVHKSDSEGAEKGSICTLDQIDSLDTIENIVNGLKRNF